MWEDKGALMLRNGFGASPWRSGTDFNKLLWTKSLEYLPMLVIRNITMKVCARLRAWCCGAPVKKSGCRGVVLISHSSLTQDGSIWKANWGEMLQADFYIDVGSGKVAEISTRTGEQYQNVIIEGIGNIRQAAKAIKGFPTFVGGEPVRKPEQQE